MSLIKLIGSKITAAIGAPTAALNFQLVMNSSSCTPIYVKTFLKRVVTKRNLNNRKINTY